MSGKKMWRRPRARLRYTNEQSLMLLKEVLDRNPFEDPYRWSQVHDNFVRMTGRPHTLRSVREHVDYLLKLYVKGDLENKARYKGSDEEHSEKLQMLQEALALKEKYFDVIQEKRPTTTTTPPRCKRPKSETASSTEDMDESTDMFLDENLDDDVPDAGMPTDAGLEFIKTRHAQEVELRRKEIELQERKLQLEEREHKLAKEKFDLEKQERLRRLEIEHQERAAHLKVLEQQQKLVRMFFEQHK